MCTVVAASLTACTAPVDSSAVTDGVPVEEAPERWSSGLDLDDDVSGDLRAEALALIEAREAGEPPADDSIIFAWQQPTTIRVWRRGLDGSSSSCSGRVDVIPLEKYVKGVLPHEWIRSWHGESLRAGAIAIRTYAANWITNGGKYTCADLDDTTASQVYKDQFFAVTNAAVDATANTYVMKNGIPVFAEYSAENGHPTATGISDSLCTGRARFGHGRGTCQWGSQRWASQGGKTHAWILEHYYPGARVVKLGGGGGGGETTIIVDNNNANNNTAKAKVELVGTWASSTSTPGYHGTDYRWAATEASSAPATFSFFLAAPATRTIDAWWVAGTNRATAATFIVYDAAGTELGRVAKNQQTAGSQWNALGTFAFKAGWNRVVLSRWQAAGSVVVADAVRVR
ncbi:MAG: hypothetical protein M3680_25775 [Myxococcota bacterium]|nr:hypothetical protein [Myxococcota bacterium]